MSESTRERPTWFNSWWANHCDLFPSTSFGESVESIAAFARSISDLFCDYSVTHAEALAASVYVQRFPPEYFVADKHPSQLLNAIVRERKAAAEAARFHQAPVVEPDDGLCRWCKDTGVSRPALAGRALCAEHVKTNRQWRKLRK